MTEAELKSAMKTTVLGVHGILQANVWVDVCDKETGEVYAWTDEDDIAVLRVFEQYSEEEVLMAEVVKLEVISSRRVTLWVSLYKEEL